MISDVGIFVLFQNIEKKKNTSYIFYSMYIFFIISRTVDSETKYIMFLERGELIRTNFFLLQKWRLPGAVFTATWNCPGRWISKYTATKSTSTSAYAATSCTGIDFKNPAKYRLSWCLCTSIICFSFPLLHTFDHITCNLVQRLETHTGIIYDLCG